MSAIPRINIGARGPGLSKVSTHTIGSKKVSASMPNFRPQKSINKQNELVGTRKKVIQLQDQSNARSGGVFMQTKVGGIRDLPKQQLMRRQRAAAYGSSRLVPTQILDPVNAESSTGNFGEGSERVMDPSAPSMQEMSMIRPKSRVELQRIQSRIRLLHSSAPNDRRNSEIIHLNSQLKAYSKNHPGWMDLSSNVNPLHRGMNAPDVPIAAPDKVFRFKGQAEATAKEATDARNAQMRGAYPDQPKNERMKFEGAVKTDTDHPRQLDHDSLNHPNKLRKVYDQRDFFDLKINKNHTIESDSDSDDERMFGPVNEEEYDSDFVPRSPKGKERDDSPDQIDVDMPNRPPDLKRSRKDEEESESSAKKKIKKEYLVPKLEKKEESLALAQEEEDEGFSEEAKKWEESITQINLGDKKERERVLKGSVDAVNDMKKLGPDELPKEINDVFWGDDNSAGNLVEMFIEDTSLVKNPDYIQQMNAERKKIRNIAKNADGVSPESMRHIQNMYLMMTVIEKSIEKSSSASMKKKKTRKMSNYVSE